MVEPGKGNNDPVPVVYRVGQAGEGKTLGGYSQVVLIAIDRVKGLLVVQVEGLARLITPRYQVVAPLEHVVNAVARPEPPRHLVEHLKTLTGAGTHIPGVLRIGTFIADDGCREFYAVRNGKRAVVIELVQEPFRRLIVEPSSHETPEECARRLRDAVVLGRSGTGSGSGY
jgi:hypothetical protein